MANRCIVLLGIGHTNAHVLRQWGRRPIPGCRLVCISRFPRTTYSGMLPGVLAGQFARGEMEIDLIRLAERCGAEWRLEETVELDPADRVLHFRDGAPLRFDAMSVGIGSVPAGLETADRPPVVPIKPMQTLVQRLDQQLITAAASGVDPLVVVIVGGGVAGAEVALCVQRRLAWRFPARSSAVRVVTASDELTPELATPTRLRLRKLLARRNIELKVGARVVDVTADGVRTDRGESLDADAVIWATGASPPPVLARLGLPLDRQGFLATDRTLRSTGGVPVFAVGDCGTIVDAPAPKAGVHAVRQGPVLWSNLGRELRGEPLLEFRPQHDFLKIINTGDGKALLEYKQRACHAAWCWWLKEWIDKGFVKQYQR
jgi:selenide,water dikinase